MTVVLTKLTFALPVDPLRCVRQPLSAQHSEGDHHCAEQHKIALPHNQFSLHQTYILDTNGEMRGLEPCSYYNGEAKWHGNATHQGPRDEWLGLGYGGSFERKRKSFLTIIGMT